MKIILNRETILKPLQAVGSIVERRPSLPILSNILLRLKNGKLTLTGTDLEVEMIAHVTIDNTDDEEITVPGRKFIDICRAFPDTADIEIAIEGERAIIRSARSRFVLATLPATEFPSIDPIVSPVELTLTQKDLKMLIEQTQFSMAQQDVRYYLNGMLLEIDGTTLRAVATDGHRLAICDMQCEQNLEVPRQVIIPRKGVTELARLLEDSAGAVQIKLSENHVKIDFDDMSFTSKLIDGKFPDYQQVIPSESNKHVLCNREILRQAFNRASVLSNEKYRGIRLNFSENMLTATVHNPEQEEAQEEIEVQYQGEDFEIGFNVAYFLDALSAIKTENVILHLTDTNHSCLVQGEGDVNSRYVIMPMRL